MAQAMVEQLAKQRAGGKEIPTADLWVARWDTRMADTWVTPKAGYSENH